MAEHGKAREVEVNDGPSPLVHLIAPLIAIAATTVARKALDGAYRGVTGHQPPDARDPNTRLRSALMWAAMTAATAAIVEVAVYRLTNDD